MSREFALEDLSQMIFLEADTRSVFIAGKEISPKRSQKIVNHSPDGFMWGYGGSGPAQLALSIMLEFLPEKEAVLVYQSFKWDLISNLDQDKNHRIEIESVEAWIRSKGHKPARS